MIIPSRSDAPATPARRATPAKTTTRAPRAARSTVKAPARKTPPASVPARPKSRPRPPKPAPVVPAKRPAAAPDADPELLRRAAPATTMPAWRDGATRASRRVRSATKRRRKRAATAAPRERRRQFPFLVVSVMIVGLLLFGVVTTNALLAQASFRLQKLSQRADGLVEEYGRLKLEVAELSSPGRVVDEASRLGLRYSDPDKVQVVAVEVSDEPSKPRGGGGTDDSENLAMIKDLLARQP